MSYKTDIENAKRTCLMLAQKIRTIGTNLFDSQRITPDQQRKLSNAERCVERARKLLDASKD